MSINEENAREYQLRAAEARKLNTAKRKRKEAINKTLSATVKEILNKPVKDPKQLAAIEQAGLPLEGKITYGEFLAASMVVREIQKGRASDFKEVMDIVGEALPASEEESKDVPVINIDV